MLRPSPSRVHNGEGANLRQVIILGMAASCVWQEASVASAFMDRLVELGGDAAVVVNLKKTPFQT